jgi:hypothetical protein
LEQFSTTTGRSKEEATIHMLTTWFNITYTSKSFRNWNVLKDQGTSDSSSGLLVNIK